MRRRWSVGRPVEPSGSNDDLVGRRTALLRRRRRAAFPGNVMSALVIIVSVWAVVAVTADTILGH